MIYTKNLTFAYNDKTAFQFPDIACEKDETLLITGASGKGKTTLLHLLAGLQKPTSGEIFIDETNITQLSERKLDAFRGKNIGLVLQQFHFVASLSVLENVTLASWLGTKNPQTEKAKNILEQLELGNQWHKLPQQLSVGQQQRVSIARALINEPKLILADEPTSSLDDANAFLVADLLSNLSKEHQAALIIVTHDYRLKNRYATCYEL